MITIGVTQPLFCGCASFIIDRACWHCANLGLSCPRGVAVMIKQILGRLPRKQSKSDQDNNSSSDVGGGGTSSNAIVYNYVNKLAPASVLCNGSSKSFNYHYEPLPSFRDVPSSDRDNLLIKN